LYICFKRLVPGAFNLVFIGSICTASPQQEMHLQKLLVVVRIFQQVLAVAAQVETETKV
jgi:hypothetical protein